VPGGPRFACYWHDGQWRRVNTVIDTIRVKGDAPWVVRLNFTLHGAVITADTALGRAYVMRGVYREPGTASYLASLSLNRARNWREFEAAMARWHMPSENMVYADVDGNIGWIAAGLMPKRTWSGLLPVPGDGRYEWSGYVYGPDLPRAYNPPEGFIATANHNILPPGYTTPIAYEWTPRYRIDRVREVLSQPRKFNVDDFKRLQHDDHSKLAEALVPRMAVAAQRAGIASRADVALLSSWNLRMARDQSAPTLFAAWAPRAYREAVQAVFAGDSAAAALAAGRTRYDWLELVLARMDRESFAGGRSAADALLLESLAAAFTEVRAQRGNDTSRWRWGDIHVARLRHPISPRYDLAPVSRGGDANTVYATGGGNYLQTSGASFREIIDFADFDNSWATNVPGQSADPRSPHYADLLPLWGRDEYFPLVYSRKRVEQETEHVTWLRPAAR
jgi:penicillin amidase